VSGGDNGLPESLADLVPAILDAGFRLTRRNLLIAGPVDPDLTWRATGAEVRANPEHACSCQAFVGVRPIGERWIALTSVVNSHPAARAVAHLPWIGVDEAYRSRGIARQMLAWVFRQLHEHGVRRLSLATAPDNLAAQSLYVRAGLRVVDQLLGFEAP
jgi:ribosomal protein S18 acetylase RimI-like enzyme